MISLRRSVTLIALASGVFAAACSKPKPVAPPPAPVVTPPPRVNQDSIDAANRARAAAAEAERQRLAAAAEAERTRLAAAAIAAARAKLTAVVYFDFDMDEIRDDQRATLDAKVAIINANPDLRIRIAGHTDDRGSDEYNLALGQRRAASVRRYLAARGVAEAKFELVSFGEQRPAVQGENEEAWSKNRRAEFEIIAGGQNLKAP